jgi:hypothetical protein
MAKKRGGGAGRAGKAGGAAAGVAAEAAPPREFNEGDLVLAKVKGWPAWPAQVSQSSIIIVWNKANVGRTP